RMASLNATQERTRAEIADYLRSFADELDPDGRSGQSNTGDGGGRSLDAGTDETGLLDGDDRSNRDAEETGLLDADGSSDGSRASSTGDKVTVIAGNESATINPPQTCLFDVTIDTDSDLLETGADRSTTFTIRW